jgi:alanine dehydrogenase
MRIGIPRELKPREGRVGLIPAACVELVRGGHEVFVEHGAGEQSGYSDQNFRDVGVTVLPSADELFDKSQMIVKVKEPIEPDLKRLRKDHLLFCYLHLAALPELTRRLVNIGLTAVAFETVEDRAGRLPLLAPMSDIAGRLSMQYATTLLHQPQGGKGILLGGVPAAKRGKVVVLGGGVAGGNSALVAAGLGAEVIVFDKDRDKLVAARAMGANVTGLYPHVADVADAVREADVVIGAVLVTGARAPHVVSPTWSARWRRAVSSSTSPSIRAAASKRPVPPRGKRPRISAKGVTHFCVTNMPGSVPRTSSQALSAAIAPFAVRLADGEWRDDPGLVRGINVEGGKVTHPALLS